MIADPDATMATSDERGSALDDTVRQSQRMGSRKLLTSKDRTMLDDPDATRAASKEYGLVLDNTVASQSILDSISAVAPSAREDGYEYVKELNTVDLSKVLICRCFSLTATM